MRTALLLPLTAVMAVAAGCASQGREQAARSVLQRDLTLASRAQEVAIASPIELRQVRPVGRTTISQRMARPVSARTHKSSAPKIRTAVLALAPAPVLAVPQPVTEPAGSTSEPANDRELLPGKTVTVIPASSGPSSAPEPAAGEFPTIRRGWGMGGGSGMGGGGCRGRRPGIGITGAPNPAFRWVSDLGL
jgi:hypothetical protein